MNHDRLHGNFHQLRMVLHQAWAWLTLDASTPAEDYAQLAARSEKRRSNAEVESDRELEQFQSSHRDWQDLTLR